MVNNNFLMGKNILPIKIMQFVQIQSYLNFYNNVKDKKVLC